MTHSNDGHDAHAHGSQQRRLPSPVAALYQPHIVCEEAARLLHEETDHLIPWHATYSKQYSPILSHTHKCKHECIHTYKNTCKHRIYSWYDDQPTSAFSASAAKCMGLFPRSSGTMRLTLRAEARLHSSTHSGSEPWQAACQMPTPR
jgi:hypothetical protein